MNSIEFTNRYFFKLQGIDLDNPVTLLEVFRVYSSELSRSFKEYDTTYVDFGSLSGTSREVIPNSVVLVLLFQDSKERIFTSVVTRYKTEEGNEVEDKLPQYLNLRGEEFKIEFTDNRKYQFNRSHWRK
ncbi:hypothetical protein LEP1GSC047_0205 [Leptospira inadai serovar Lyme str. 10]|uniref:Uncharacterized protein n=2 Tax=Leptospira inadai serovar Lyme TaxID=293084 RepID=V6I0Z3_9LEPT|nr:hypothetical protein [Leptospira inadai]EQA38939.1 hypothetical protein LEP1GSC047_0205 [Leptospira inadai serovar Lyme str. 10]PNV72105.1 hypothetical protein BES34_019950 [Leptospira inadai serovar Lyme]